ncbi:leucine-rich repeat-containing protein 63 [Heteronotia binoei]|uniref:leucine-rich repeat-containing protein 63 n=1 Tax=Heteronotia binoei TaxID=13085 RepID=UPI002930B631|nr:leucine-rich repeat-containing protein 63 [Heteronotia binoei]
MVKRGHKCSGIECHTKIKSLKRDYKCSAQHNNRTGNSPCFCQYYQVLDRLFGGSMQSPENGEEITLTFTLGILGIVPPSLGWDCVGDRPTLASCSLPPLLPRELPTPPQTPTAAPSLTWDAEAPAMPPTAPRSQCARLRAQGVWPEWSVRGSQGREAETEPRDGRGRGRQADTLQELRMTQALLRGQAPTRLSWASKALNGDTSAIHSEGRAEDAESKEKPGDGGGAGGKSSVSMKSHQILFSLPDSTDGTSSPLDYAAGSQAPLDSIKRDFIIPLQLSGPPSFPLQKRRIPLRLKLPNLKLRRLFLPSDFTLKGHTAVVSCSSRRVSGAHKKPIISHFNYEVRSAQLMYEVLKSGQMEVNTIMLPMPGFPFTMATKPERQLLSDKFLEQLHASLAAEISEEAIEEKISFHDDEQKKRKKKVSYADQVSDSEALSLVSGVGCRSELGPEGEERDLMARAEMAVFCCLMHRRTGLSLKAYFLPRLPDLSALTDFLLYLNLSFNDLHLFPTEVCDLKNLQILKLRNNPIKSIPEDIKKLKDLRTLVMSFNLLTELPSWLFMLQNLELLDVCYNELEYISNAISNARSLSCLIVEGNLLYALPCGILKLPLKCLKVENNFLHPFFWRELEQLQPQRLTDMASLCFVQSNLRKRYPKIPEDIQKLLGSCGTCDCCSGPLYGQGFRFLRAYKNIYGLRLPYLFSACSPACYMNFVSGTISNSSWQAFHGGFRLAAADSSLNKLLE